MRLRLWAIYLCTVGLAIQALTTMRQTPAASEGAAAVAEASGGSQREIEWMAIGLFKALKAGYPESDPDPLSATERWLRPLRELAHSHPNHERAQQLYLMGLNYLVYYATEAGEADFAETLESEFKRYQARYPNSEPVQYMVAARALDDVRLDQSNGVCPDWERRRHQLRRLSEQFEKSERIRPIYLTALTAVRSSTVCQLDSQQRRTLRLTFLNAVR